MLSDKNLDIETAMVDRRESSIAELRNRLFRTLFLRESLILLVGWLFLWGCAVLVLRVSDAVRWLDLFWGAVGLAIIPVIALYLTGKKLPDNKSLGASIDRENQAGGLIMSSFEADVKYWAATLPPLAVPVVKWEGKKTYTYMFFAVVFIMTAFMLPDSTIIADHERPLNIDDQVAKLKGKLETLEDEKILEVEKVEALKLSLERIQKDADGLGPVKTLDALDHLNDQLQQKSEEAAEKGLQETETLSKAEALAEHAEHFAENLSPEDAKDIMQGLSEMLNEMFAESPELFDELAEQLGSDGGNNEKSKDGNNDNEGNDNKGNGKQGKKGSGGQKIDSEALKKMLQNKKLENLTPEQLQQLKESLANRKDVNREMLEKLMEKGMIDPEMLKQLEDVEKVDEEELERLLAELGACEGGDCDCEGECDGTCPAGGRPGSGGINRGRGDAPIQYGENEADPEGTEFKSQILPPANLNDLKDSMKFGSSRTSPQLTPEGSPSDNGNALQNTDGGTGGAYGQTIRPQYRGPVGRYFDR